MFSGTGTGTGTWDKTCKVFKNMVVWLISLPVGMRKVHNLGQLEVRSYGYVGHLEAWNLGCFCIAVPYHGRE